MKISELYSSGEVPKVSDIVKFVLLKPEDLRDKSLYFCHDQPDCVDGSCHSCKKVLNSLRLLTYTVISPNEPGILHNQQIVKTLVIMKANSKNFLGLAHATYFGVPGSMLELL